LFQSVKQGFMARIRLHQSALVDPILTGLMVHFVVHSAKSRAARIGVTPQALKGAEELTLAQSPKSAEPAIKKRFAALARVFESLGFLDSEPGHWTGSGRIQQKQSGDRDAVESALDFGDHSIVTENPRSIPNPLLLALDIKLVTSSEMFFEANRQIPQIVGEAMVNHFRRTGYPPEFYEAFLQKSGIGFLVPLFRSTLG